MVISHSHKAALLPRLLSLKDNSPFILMVDSITQSADNLLAELLHQIPTPRNVILVSFESLDTQDSLINHFIHFTRGVAKIEQELTRCIDKSMKNIVLIDSFNYIPAESLSQFCMTIIKTGCILVGVYHEPVHTLPISTYYPSPLTLLSYFATSVLTISPNKSIDESEIRMLEYTFVLPLGVNDEVFKVHLVHRRRSGRAIHAWYTVNSKTHEIIYNPTAGPESEQEDEAMLKGLTTFNLSKTEKQKQDKEKVELPYLQAQELGSGGAIIYEFEKDDDYDEEDPYEDPF